MHNDRLLFEFVILEGAQGGLSWDTILKKRVRYREVFDGFDVEKVARYDKRKVRELLKDARDYPESAKDCGNHLECAGVLEGAGRVRDI